MQRSSGVLAARSVSKSYGDTLVLDRVSLVVSPGSRIGVVGPNGIGKSTLLRLLAGLEEPDAGRVERHASVAYLAQEAEPSGCSGGEAARAKLEVLIAADADVVLLDEPTNDLDLAGLELLDRFVARFRGGLVAVSHDRVFLEQMTTIVELEAETRHVHVYAGGWSDFASARDLAHTRHERAYERFERERDTVEAQARRMREWEQRGYGQGRKKKKGKDLAKSTEKKLGRVAQVEKPWSPWQLQLAFAPNARGSDVVAGLDGAVVERDGFRLGPVDFEVRHGERLALVGRNGAGKTTLLKALLGELPLASGRRRVGPGVAIGTLPQGAGPFATDARLLDAFTAASETTTADARTLLAKFALGADDVGRRGSSLSPGERSRATLALLAARGVNALVLDEPTNNLDLEAVEQLEETLAGYSGTVVLVTHDRRFFEAFAPTRTYELRP